MNFGLYRRLRRRRLSSRLKSLPFVFHSQIFSWRRTHAHTLPLFHINSPKWQSTVPIVAFPFSDREKITHAHNFALAKWIMSKLMAFRVQVFSRLKKKTRKSKKTYHPKALQLLLIFAYNGTRHEEEEKKLSKNAENDGKKWMQKGIMDDSERRSRQRATVQRRGDTCTAFQRFSPERRKNAILLSKYLHFIKTHIPRRWIEIGYPPMDEFRISAEFPPRSLQLEFLKKKQKLRFDTLATFDFHHLQDVL